MKDRYRSQPSRRNGITIHPLDIGAKWILSINFQHSTLNVLTDKVFLNIDAQFIAKYRVIPESIVM